MKFEKEALDVNQQLDLLKKRGLIIDNEDRVLNYLEHIGYFRLSGYFKHYQEEDQFYDGTTFDVILDTYVFDRKLRLLTLDAIEKIEVSLKSNINNFMVSQYGVFWYTNEELFNLSIDKNIELYKRLKERIRDIKGNNSPYIKNYIAKYTDEDNLPSWMLFEEFTLGNVADIYRVLKATFRPSISSNYNVSQWDLQRWIYMIRILRNISAHHARLWNKKYVSYLRVKDSIFKNKFKTYENNGAREVMPNYYNATLIIHHMLKIIHPNFERIDELEKLFKNYDNRFIINMGFEKAWKNSFT